MPSAPRSPVHTAADPLVALADRCVQCGLCLPACPTYGHDRVEAESPRGRITLARGWTLGTIPATPAGDAHLDHCLGCRSCEVVCPAGVKYGELLIQARARQRARRDPGPNLRWMEWLTARPPLLRAVMRLYRLAYPLLPGRLRWLPRPPKPSPSLPSAQGVALFTGCIADSYETGLRHAVARLAAAVGETVAVPRDQTCCGSLHAHAGNLVMRDRLAAANRRAFGNDPVVLTLASGCHEAVASALAGVATTEDAIAWTAARAHALAFRPTYDRVALHVPCTQRNVVKSVAALRGLLAHVPGLDVVELSAGYGCCGAAGTQMLQDPGRAADYRQPLLDQLERSGATRLLSANIGCRLHFANATTLPVQHPLEFLAERLATTEGARDA